MEAMAAYFTAFEVSIAQRRELMYYIKALDAEYLKLERAGNG